MQELTINFPQILACEKSAIIIIMDVKAPRHQHVEMLTGYHYSHQAYYSASHSGWFLHTH